MKALLPLLLLTGCGALFGDETTTIDISAPPGARVMLDNRLVRAPFVEVAAHRPHTISAFDKDGKALGTCTFEPEVQARYIVGDVLLIETLFPIIDLVTGDYAQIEPGQRCDF